MDQGSSQTMDKKVTSRPLQLTAKLHDSNKEACKKNSNGSSSSNSSSGGGSGGGSARRLVQQREADAGGGAGGGNRTKQKGVERVGVSGGGRVGNRYSRHREKEGGQVERIRKGGSGGTWSPADPGYIDYCDDEYDHQTTTTTTRGNNSFRFTGKQHHYSADITHELQSWWTASGGRGGGGYNRQQRQQQYHHHYNDGNNRRGGRGKKSLGYSGNKAVRKTKDRAIQARCQFLVNFAIDAADNATTQVPVGCAPPVGLATPSLCSGGDDPDALVSWAAIEEVFLHTTQPTHCPVCLYPPVAPQVTRCGHLYCYPCILHYLALSDHKWRACPICYEMVVRDDLKSAVCVVHPDYSVGSNVRLTLMQRARHSLVATPVEGGAESSSSRDRKMRATEEKVLSIIGRERCALEVQMTAEGQEPEACFIEQALILIKEREGKLHAAYDEQDLAFAVEAQTTLSHEETESGVATSAADDPVSDLIRGISTLAATDNLSSINKDEVCLKKMSKNNKKSKRRKKKNYIEAVENIAAPSPSYDCVFEPPPDKPSEDFNNKCCVFSDNEQEDVDIIALSSPISKSTLEADTAGSFQDFQLPSHARLTSSFNNETSGIDETSDVHDCNESVVKNYQTDFLLGRSESLQFYFEEERQELQCLEFSSDAPIVDDLKPVQCFPVGFSSELYDNTDESIAERSLITDLSPNTNHELNTTAGTNPSADATLGTDITGATPSSSTGPKSVYHFYQASDGSHVYLHPLNMAMISYQYKSPDLFPRTIEARVVEKDCLVMDESSRDRTKPLRHLPLCCPYEVVEVLLGGPMVSQDSMQHFQHRLQRREQQRALREKQEQLIEERNREQQDREMSSHLFTTVYSATRDSGTGACERERTFSGGGGASSPEFPCSSPPLGGPAITTSNKKKKNKQQHQPSFAKMVVDAPAVSVSSSVAPSWPTLSGGWCPRATASWGTNAPAAAAAEPPRNDRDLSPSLHRSPPNFRNSFAQDLEMVLQRQQEGGDLIRKTKKGKRKFVPLSIVRLN